MINSVSLKIWLEPFFEKVWRKGIRLIDPKISVHLPMMSQKGNELKFQSLLFVFEV